MVEFLNVLSTVCLFVLAGFICYFVYRDFRRREKEQAEFVEMRRHFMSAALVYFNTMHRYICGLTSYECVQQCPHPEDDEL